MQKRIALNIRDTVFNEETHFERCNIWSCTFNTKCYFDRCNIIECKNTENCECVKSNIIDHEDHSRVILANPHNIEVESTEIEETD